MQNGVTATGPVMDFGEIVKRQLHFFWLVDYSGSMEGSKIETLNRAIREAIPEVIRALENHPEVQIMMRAIKFSTNVGWHVGPQAVPVEKFIWTDLQAEGTTSTASAIELLCDSMNIEKMSKRGFPPVCILISDGYCTQPDEQYIKAIEKLNNNPWGKKAVRLVIAIGNESDYDEEALLRFTNHQEVGILKASSPEKLVSYIKWASTTASVSSSITISSAGESTQGSNINQASNILLSTPPDIIGSADDVF